MSDPDVYLGTQSFLMACPVLVASHYINNTLSQKNIPGTFGKEQDNQARAARVARVAGVGRVEPFESSAGQLSS